MGAYVRTARGPGPVRAGVWGDVTKYTILSVVLGTGSVVWRWGCGCFFGCDRRPRWAICGQKLSPRQKKRRHPQIAQIRDERQADSARESGPELLACGRLATLCSADRATQSLLRPAWRLAAAPRRLVIGRAERWRIGSTRRPALPGRRPTTGAPTRRGSGRWVLRPSRARRACGSGGCGTRSRCA